MIEKRKNQGPGQVNLSGWTGGALFESQSVQRNFEFIFARQAKVLF